MKLIGFERLDTGKLFCLGFIGTPCPLNASWWPGEAGFKETYIDATVKVPQDFGPLKCSVTLNSSSQLCTYGLVRAVFKLENELWLRPE